MKRMAWLILVFAAIAHPIVAATLTLPQDAETRENVYSFAPPFSFSGDVRSQHVYSNGLFPPLSEPGQLFQIDSIAFRLASQGSFGFGAEATFDRVEVLISSSVGPFTLNLEQNHGLNRQVVYDDALTISGRVPPGTSPSLFDLQIDFTSPFLYDPATGALVVEIRKYGGNEVLSTLGGAEIPGTIFYAQVGAGPISTLENAGLETQFSYQVVPEPSTLTLVVLGILVFAMRAKHHQRRNL